MEFVTAINRSSKPLWATWDGKKYQVKPGKNAYPRIVAEAAKRQNPIMGSEDPYSGEMRYLIGIEEDGDDCSPAEQSTEITRRALRDQGEVEVVKGKNGLYANEVRSTLPLDSSFVKP